MRLCEYFIQSEFEFFLPGGRGGINPSVLRTAGIVPEASVHRTAGIIARTADLPRLASSLFTPCTSPEQFRTRNRCQIFASSFDSAESLDATCAMHLSKFPRQPVRTSDVCAQILFSPIEVLLWGRSRRLSAFDGIRWRPVAVFDTFWDWRME